MTMTMPELLSTTLDADSNPTTSTIGAYVTHRHGVEGTPTYMIVGRVIAVEDGIATCVGSDKAVYDGDVEFRVFRFADYALDLHLAGTGHGLTDRYKVGLPQIVKALAAQRPDTPGTAELEALNTRIRELEEQRQNADRLARDRGAEIDRLNQTHEEFRQRVGRVAMVYARRHDWCSVVQAALNELGIEVSQRYRVRTDVFVTNGEWTAKREDVYVTVESAREHGYVYRDVDGMDADDAINALESAGVYLPDGWEFDKFDASTSDVTAVDDE